MGRPKKPGSERSRKTSLWLAPDILDVIESTARPGEDQSVSSRINGIILRYGELVRRSAPELSLGEWCAVCEANSGTSLDDSPGSVSWLWANVHDSKALGEKWDINQKKLVAKMQSWTYAESLAAAEIIERFWSDPSARQDNHDWLAKCGARVSE